jgi:hypothetical protein
VSEDIENFTTEQAGEILIRQGRIWLKLTEEDVERGARAITRDPHYREEIWRSAVRHSEECCACPSVAEINAAYERLGGRLG